MPLAVNSPSATYLSPEEADLADLRAYLSKPAATIVGNRAVLEDRALLRRQEDAYTARRESGLTLRQTLAGLAVARLREVGPLGDEAVQDAGWRAQHWLDTYADACDREADDLGKLLKQIEERRE